ATHRIAQAADPPLLTPLFASSTLVVPLRLERECELPAGRLLLPELGVDPAELDVDCDEAAVDLRIDLVDSRDVDRDMLDTTEELVQSPEKVADCREPALDADLGSRSEQRLDAVDLPVLDRVLELEDHLHKRRAPAVGHS